MKNQLQLALKISKYNTQDIQSENYCEELKQIVGKMLTKDPELRPSATEILKEPIFSSRNDEFQLKIENLMQISSRYNRRNSLSSTNLNNSNVNNSDNTNSQGSPNFITSTQIGSSGQNFTFPLIASKLSEVYVWGGGKMQPKRVEFFKDENAPLKVALGTSHYAVITVEKELYTWSVMNF
jgi:serine/threonine protein kinase